MKISARIGENVVARNGLRAFIKMANSPLRVGILIVCLCLIESILGLLWAK